MIDIENAVFAKVANKLRATFSPITVRGNYEDSPTSFPAVAIWENDNSVYQKMRTTGKIENAASLMYEVEVYSNTLGYKKEECQEIMSVIDDVMAEMGFTRTMCSPISNLEDATIYRLHARYTGIVVNEITVDEYGMDVESFRIYTN